MALIRAPPFTPCSSVSARSRRCPARSQLCRRCPPRFGEDGSTPISADDHVQPVIPGTTPDEYATPRKHATRGRGRVRVLLNDSAQSHPMSAALVAQPPSGQVQFPADGSFTYTPNVGFVGEDTFNYTATETTPPGSTPSPPTPVTITVTTRTAPPPATGEPFAVRPGGSDTNRRRVIGLGAANGPVAVVAHGDHRDGKAGIPVGATGVVVNITAAEGVAGGYLQAFPTGTGVAGATTNVNIDHSTPPSPTSPLWDWTNPVRFTIFSFRPTQLVVDVFGDLVPAATAGPGEARAARPGACARHRARAWGPRGQSPLVEAWC